MTDGLTNMSITLWVKLNHVGGSNYNPCFFNLLDSTNKNIAYFCYKSVKVSTATVGEYTPVMATG